MVNDWLLTLRSLDALINPSKFGVDQFIVDSEVVRVASGAAIPSGLQHDDALDKHACSNRDSRPWKRQ